LNLPIIIGKIGRTGKTLKTIQLIILWLELTERQSAMGRVRLKRRKKGYKGLNWSKKWGKGDESYQFSWHLKIRNLSIKM
jgi:hypothetical protein